MASRLTKLDVLRIAALARLELSDTEIDLFTSQLERILDYASEVQHVETSGVPPTSHLAATVAAWRDDVPVPPLARDSALANAPDATRDAGLFKVPRVL